MNVFISYNFENDRLYMERVSSWLSELQHRNYSLSVQDRSDQGIWNEIYKRSWVCSVIIVLIGSQTNKSRWIEREIDECLKIDTSLQKSSSRRVRRPKGILAIQLPGGPHTIPKTIANRLNEKTAVGVEWTDVNSGLSLNENLALAQKLRPSV